MPKKDHLTAALIKQLEKKGGKAKIIPIKYLFKSIEEILEKHHSGLISDQLFRCHFKDFERKPSATLNLAQSLIVTATPQPRVLVHFCLDGRSFKAIIPPNYQSQTDRDVEQIIRNVIEPYGYSLTEALGPLKLLAVASGLASYGRNNISYIEGYGSFFRLKAYYSDLAPGENSWQPYQMNDMCANCHACLNACPTGTIAETHFPVNADRCLTYLNENFPDFPKWVSPKWHNCLVGCMRCQAVCPLNKKFMKWVEDRERFTDEETRYLLGKPPDQFPSSLMEKLKRLDIAEYAPLLSRNLSALLNNI